jgi:preprotein translocase subunit SecG
MENVILTIHLILALLLIGAVLLQRSEGGGLGIGGGANGTMSARGAATALTKLTWIFAIAFLITSMTLTVLATSGANNSSVVDALAADGTATDAATPAEEAPLNPELTGDLTAPGADDAPAAPPKADAPADGATSSTSP